LTPPLPDHTSTLSLHDALPISYFRPLKSTIMNLVPSLFILSLPKAELHLHLEGSTLPTTLLELMRRPGTPDASLAAIEQLYQFEDRKSTRLNSSHEWISYAVFC